MCTCAVVASSGRPGEKKSHKAQGSGTKAKGERGFRVSKRRDIAGKGATCVPHKYCDSLATRFFACSLATSG
jgi:hypothetical protein